MRRSSTSSFRQRASHRKNFASGEDAPLGSAADKPPPPAAASVASCEMMLSRYSSSSWTSSTFCALVEVSATVAEPPLLKVLTAAGRVSFLAAEIVSCEHVVGLAVVISSLLSTTIESAAVVLVDGPSLRSQPLHSWSCLSSSSSELLDSSESSPKALHGDHEEGFENAQTVQITWETPKGERVETKAKCGMNLMRVAHARGVDLEGACEGVCACSTCHVILAGEVFDELPEPSEDEEDMLDLAFGLTETSRLGCQVIVTPEMDGIVVKLPAATRNFYVDGHVPQPH